MGLCRIKKRKGWSARNTTGGILYESSIMMATVAAAASVPTSLTSTKALWTTFDSTRSSEGDMPVTEMEYISRMQESLTWENLRILLVDSSQIRFIVS